MISKRLSLISNLIPFDFDVADIGSDHGFLLIDLINRGFKKNLLGVENKKGPFDILVNNVNKFNFNKNIKCSYSDGLDDVSDNFKTIVIAGMGIENIKSIINRNLKKLDSIEYFIIDSHTDFYETRNFFVNLGYFIENENIINDKKITYEIIRFKKGSENYSFKELFFGPILLKNKDEIFLEYIRKIYFKNTNILKRLNNYEDKEKFLKINEYIKEILND